MTTDLKFRAPMSARMKNMLERATALASTSQYRHRHGAIIMKHGKIISSGVNYKVNAPFQVTNPLTEAGVHAEVAAIKKANGADLRGAIIFVARVSRNGEQAMSKPCLNCQAALRKAGIKKVYYTIDSEMDL